MTSFEEAIITSFLAGGAGAALVFYLAKAWLGARLRSSIQHEYDLKLERVKEASLIKAKAEVVAELFAEWLSYPDDQRRLNQLTFEAFLWLPNDILEDLSELLAHRADAPGVREIIARVRGHLLGSSELPADKVIVFPQQHVQRRHEKEREAQQAAAVDGGFRRHN